MSAVIKHVVTAAFMVLLTMDGAAQRPRKVVAPAPASQSEQPVSRNSVEKVSSREEFDAIARTFHQGTSYALPHAMFVIDRRANNKIYYVNSQKFRFHKDFLLGTYLVPRG